MKYDTATERCHRQLEMLLNGQEPMDPTLVKWINAKQAELIARERRELIEQRMNDFGYFTE